VRRAKRGVSRRLPLPPSAVEALQRYLDEGRPLLVAGGRDDEGRLLLGVGGRPLGRDGIYERVRRVSARCGARTHPHAFRRTLATELARAGVSLPVIQDVLGHAHLSMTSSYVQVGVPEMRGALDALDRTRPESHRVRPGRAVQKQLFAGWAFGGVTDSPFRSSPTQPEMAAQSWMALGRQVEEA
jgi:integrase